LTDDDPPGGTLPPSTPADDMAAMQAEIDRLKHWTCPQCGYVSG